MQLIDLIAKKEERRIKYLIVQKDKSNILVVDKDFDKYANIEDKIIIYEFQPVDKQIARQIFAPKRVDEENSELIIQTKNLEILDLLEKVSDIEFPQDENRGLILAQVSSNPNVLLETAIKVLGIMCSEVYKEFLQEIVDSIEETKFKDKKLLEDFEKVNKEIVKEQNRKKNKEEQIVKQESIKPTPKSKRRKRGETPEEILARIQKQFKETEEKGE